MTPALHEAAIEKQLQTHFQALQLNNQVKSLLILAEATLQAQQLFSHSNKASSLLNILARSKSSLARLEEGGPVEYFKDNPHIPFKDLVIESHDTRARAVLGSKPV